MNYRTFSLITLVAIYSLIYFIPTCFADIYPLCPFTDTTIQDMIDAAEEGDTVLVAPGIYTGEGNRDISFHGKDIVLLSEDGPEHTKIDCEELGRGFHIYSGESADAVISGFTVINGFADNRGASIYISNSAPLIDNCYIFSGFSPNGGAGICLESSSSVIDSCYISGCYRRAIYSEYSNNLIINCLIQDNSSMNRGAGLYLYRTIVTVHDCVIADNIIDAWSGDAQGGGIYSYKSDIMVERCEITNNRCEGGSIASVEGGGIYCEERTAIISECLISDNSAEKGGGIFVDGNDYTCIASCDIRDNWTTRYYGGGMRLGYSSDVLITDCLVSGNYAVTQGGGLIVYYLGQLEIKGCTFIMNVAGEYGGGIRSENPDYGNCENIIVRNNIPDQIVGAPDIAWSNIENGWPGEGNIDEDPLFVAPEYGDYRLLWGSPCIDSGNPDSLDLDGTRSDMGAFSFDQSKELIVYLSPETGEIVPGETGQVKYTVCNSFPSEKSFGTAAGVRLPDGSLWPGNPLEEPFYTSIAPLSNLVSEFEYRVPMGWVPGTYSLATGVGYRGRVFDLDHFEFKVVEDSTDIR